MNEPSKRYFQALDETTDYHARKDLFTGRFLLNYRKQVEQIVADYGIKTALDYGCGKGRQWSEPIGDGSGEKLAERLGVTPTLYDPAVPAFSKEPTGKFDLVICTQVLCYVPMKDLGWVMERLNGFASKAIFIGERMGPIKKPLQKAFESEMPRNWPHEKWKEEILKTTFSVPVYLASRGSKWNDHVSKFEQIA